MPKCSSIGASMLESTLQPFAVQTWTWVSCNTRTAGSGAMRPSHAEFKVPNTSNVTALTSLRTTTNLGGAVRLMRRQIYCTSKRRRANPTLTPSSAPIAGVTIKQIPTNVPSGDTTSTENGSRRSILRSVKTGSNLFALQKAAWFNYDPMKS